MMERLSRALSWWFGELAALLPGRRRGGQVLALWREGRLEFWLRGEGITKTAAPQAGSAVVLRLVGIPPWRHVFALPNGAKPYLAQLFASEMDRRTPWRAEQVHFHVTAEAGPAPGQIAAALTLLPRDRAEAAVAALRGSGLAPAAIELTDSADPSVTGPLAALDNGRSLPGSVPRRPALILGAILAAALLSLAVQAIWLAGLEARLAKLRFEASSAKKLAGEITALRRSQDYPRTHRAEIPTALATLDALAQLLPDDSWAEQLRLGAGAATLSGQSADAARLLPIFGDDRRFKDPRFGAPLMAAPNGGQRFQLTAKLSGAP